MDINLKENEFLAIRVEQPFGCFYSVSLKSDFLLKRSYSTTVYQENSRLRGSQRKINPGKVDAIREFIDNDEAMFPSSIIVAVNYDKNDQLAEEDDRWKIEEIDTCRGICKLIVPNEKKICSIVDGQHRLFGFNNAQRNFDLNCSIYLDLPPSLQARVFATINFNQSPVDKSLAYSLFGYQLDAVESKHWSPDLLAIHLSQLFSVSEGSYFKNHIHLRLGVRNTPNGFWSISTASFIDGVVKLISSDPKMDRYKINERLAFGLAGRKSLYYDSSLPLREYYIKHNDKAIEQTIDAFFLAVKNNFEIGDVSDSIFTKTIGVSALFQLLGKILKANGVSKDTLNSFEVLLGKAKIIKFDDRDFYPSSTKGQTRLVRMLEHIVLDVPFEMMGIRDQGAITELNNKAKTYLALRK